MVWSDIRLVKAKFQEQIPRKPDLNNIKIIIVTYFMLQIKKSCYYAIIFGCIFILQSFSIVFSKLIRANILVIFS